MSQSVKLLALGFGPGRDLTVSVFEPHVRLRVDTGACLEFFLSLSLSPPLPLALSLSVFLSENKLKKKKDFRHC